jgi:predicted Zn-dependent peptidase
MLGLICSLALLGQAESSVVQKELPNGAKFRIEATPGTGTLMIALYASEAGLPNDGGVPGTRHLLEHLIAKGGDRLLDTKLESVGLSLTAFTERDGTAFVVMGSSRQSVLGIESLRDLLEPLRVDVEELAVEIKILEQESALRADYEPFLDRAWLDLW